MIIVNQEQVRELLPVGECLAVMDRVLRGLAQGECTLPLRQIMWLEQQVGALGLMPAYWKPANVIGLKAVTYFPGNEGSALDSHQGAVLLYDAACGRLLAVVDATEITAIRTAAVSGVATQALARNDASDLTLIGSGVQARTHLAAMLAARDIKRVRVCGRRIENAQRFAEREGRRHAIEIEPVASVREAVDGADIICTATSSKEPVLRGEWIEPGAHINAVGSSVKSARELDAAAVQRSRLFVDRRESALSEAGDFLLARQDGAVDDEHIVAEIGEVLVGRTAGRQRDDEITLFKSVGLAIEDLAAALHVYEKVKSTGVGVEIAFGGARCDAD